MLSVFDVVDRMEELGPPGLPSAVIMELTYRCNLSCPHCYNADPGAQGYAKEISGAQFRAIQDQLPELGTFSVVYQGGEIFLHPEWRSILEHARGLGMYIGIKTNALPLTPGTSTFSRPGRRCSAP